MGFVGSSGDEGAALLTRSSIYPAPRAGDSRRYRGFILDIPDTLLFSKVRHRRNQSKAEGLIGRRPPTYVLVK
jgi:hypothetical protein